MVLAKHPNLPDSPKLVPQCPSWLFFYICQRQLATGKRRLLCVIFGAARRSFLVIKHLLPGTSGKFHQNFSKFKIVHFLDDFEGVCLCSSTSSEIGKKVRVRRIPVCDSPLKSFKSNQNLAAHAL